MEANALGAARSQREAGRVLAGVGAGSGLLIAVLAAYATALLVSPDGTAPDTWLAIVAGREIRHGLPSVDHLAVMTAGRRWVDQQWLAQTFFYGAYRAGGLFLVVLLNAAAALSAVVAAVAAARARGGNARTIAWVAAAAVVAFLSAAEVPRAQSLSYPLFVLVVWLIVGDSVRPSRRVLFALPLLALWANLHGSVLIGACLLIAHGLLVVRRRLITGAMLIVGPVACLFASPYATGLPAYYRSTTLNPTFKLLSEWGPTTLSLETIPFFVLLGSAIYLFGRAGRSFTATELTVLLVTGIAGLHAIRFMVWFALASLIVLPHALAAVAPHKPAPEKLDRLCARAGFATVVVAIAIVLLRGVSGYPSAASAAVTSAAGEHGKVFASSLYGDWLLGVAPQLRGRVAFDSRIELLPAATADRIELVQAIGYGWPDLARTYSVFVLNSSDERALVSDLAAAGYARLYKGAGLVVMARR